MSAPLQSAHTHLVKTVYRQTLKLYQNWCVDLTLFHREALQVRRQFDAARTLEPGAALSKIRAQQAWIKEHQHPDPYCIPTQQGGSSFQRNVAPPVEILGVPKTLSSKYGGGAHH